MVVTYLHENLMPHHVSDLQLADARHPELCSDTTLLLLLVSVQLSAHPCSLAILVDVVMFGD